MGSVCSCFGAADVEEHRNRHGSVYRQGVCIRFLAQQLMHMYSLLLHREYRPAPLNSSSLASVAHTNDDSFSGTFRCPPRPLPYDDPRCSGLNVNVLASRYKSSAAFVEESESFRADKNNGNSESTSLLDKWSGYNHGSSKKLSSECSLNHSSVETTGGATYMFPSSEEEDVCPTCLEEYTAENPRIILQCSHHFHLGCIYEWMERSNLCPVCGKVMVFNETS